MKNHVKHKTKVALHNEFLYLTKPVFFANIKNNSVPQKMRDQKCVHRREHAKI